MEWSRGMGNVHALQASVGRTAACAAQACAETIVRAAATGANAPRMVVFYQTAPAFVMMAGLVTHAVYAL